MLSQAENERLTRVGSGTPMGTLLRRYWLPALLAEEVPERDSPPVRVRLLGEDLVAFRDSDGVVGLVAAYCPHRRAPLFFGRNEECGLRCVYHGWKFDRDGACVDMPSEPPDSLVKTKVKIEAYPTWEGGGMIWAYLGPPEHRPAPPDHELVRTTHGHRYVSKSYQECNWLQALEGGVDPTHATIMHNGNIGDRSFLNDYDKLVAELNLERTDYGFTYTGIRPRGQHTWVRGSGSCRRFTCAHASKATSADPKCTTKSPPSTATSGSRSTTESVGSTTSATPTTPPKNSRTNKPTSSKRA